MTQPLRSHRLMFPFMLIALALVIAPASRVAAHEDGNEGARTITLRAPLDAADCAATPPTITVLGLAIDVSTATFGGDHHDGGDDGNAQGDNEQGDDNENDDGDDDHGGDTPPSCADLVAGQPVV